MKYLALTDKEEEEITVLLQGVLEGALERGNKEQAEKANRALENLQKDHSRPERSAPVQKNPADPVAPELRISVTRTAYNNDPSCPRQEIFFPVEDADRVHNFMYQPRRPMTLAPMYNLVYILSDIYFNPSTNCYDLLYKLGGVTTT